ncbi:unnamed protein product [Cuscuta europaea]|uniref:Uncharacterized protein n=2 Tax=Cuscuta europaea TaxID=41803 RepID=A0A9P0ZD26_CUSEU|nr:unnamed protein product [Cuscuta europaea]
MPRYDDDRYGSTTRLYVGHLSSRTRTRDLEHKFSKFGRVRQVDMKRDYAFIDYSDPRDADDARHYLDGSELDGHRIIVEFAKGVPRGSGGSRDYLGRGPPPGSGRCFNCGLEGHWARDCKAGDWKNKCYRCGERGHIEKKCPNSPQKLKRGRSYSRTPDRSRSPYYSRRHSRSYSPRRSYSRSRSPVARRERVGHERRSPPSRSPVSSRSRSRSPHDERSPRPSKTQKHNPPTRDDSRSPLSGDGRDESPPPPSKRAQNASSPEDDGYDRSHEGRSQSPMSPRRGDGSAYRKYDESPLGAKSRSPSPKYEKRHADSDDGADDN